MAQMLLLASIIASNTQPALGQIGAFYFDSLNQTQVWINLEPKNLQPGPNLRLNITVFFPGRTLSTAPSTVDVRVEDNCLMFPLQIRVPSLSLVYDGVELRGGAQGLPIVSSSNCGDEWGFTSGATTTMRIPFEALRRFNTARYAEIHAFGFLAGLTASDRNALASFIRAVSDGVRLK